MRGTPGVGNGRPGRKASRAETIDEAGQHQLLATLKVIGVFGVHDDPVAAMSRIRAQ